VSAPTVGSAQLAIAPVPATVPGLERFASFEDVVALIRARRDVRLLVEVEAHVRLAHYAPGRIEFAPAGDAPRDLAARIARRLQDWTGSRWGVSVVAEADAPTIAETRLAEKGALMQHPMLQAVLAAFPGIGADDITVHEPAPAVDEDLAPPEPEEGEAWNPLDDFD